MLNITCKVCNETTTKLCDHCSNKQKPNNNSTENVVLPHVGVNSSILNLQAGLPGLIYKNSR